MDLPTWNALLERLTSGDTGLMLATALGLVLAVIVVVGVLRELTS